MAINTGKPGEVVKLSPDLLTADQREYIRLVELGQDKELVLKIAKLVAPQLTSFTQVDVSISLNYLMHEMLKDQPKSEYLDRLREDIAKVGTALYYIKGTSIDRKEKGIV